MKNVIKILVINLAVMAGIFVIAECGARAYLTFLSCLNGDCEGSLVTSLNLFPKMQDVGISTRDPVLGYKPKPNFSGIIHKPPGWDNVYVSIDRNGFRRNTDDNKFEHSRKDILTVGNSFTFGDQVDNSDTVPACLAQKTGLDVWNGGVFGYGATQAVLRAEQEVGKHGPFDIIIWSITIPSDFARDQLMVRSNMPKPYVATVEEETKVIRPSYFDGSSDFMWMLGYSVILKEYMLPILEEEGDFTYQGTYHITGENAANLEEIIELGFQRFATIPGTKRKAVLLQYDSWIFGNEEFQIRNRERELIKMYGEKYHSEIIDSLDKIYIPEMKNEIWFGIKDYGHHTPYGNQMVCEIVLNWLTKPPPGQPEQ